MAGIFDALPGIDAPVGSISKSLSQMWEGTASEGKPSPGSEHARAIQVNFVLHLGLKTGAADAVRQFKIAVSFSHRYPSRVVVLCPLPDDSGQKEMRAKVYGECSVGKTPEDTRCCEFVMLSYPQSARAYLESQVSICLSTDIPLYYWAHRFSDAAKLADYRYLLTSAKRVLIDSATAPADAMGYPWPRPENVRDLAFARLLHVRQSIGQYLGRYPVETLARGLRKVRLEYGDGVEAEARVLLAWMCDRLRACGASGESAKLVPSKALRHRAFALSLGYDDSRFLAWKADLDSAHGCFTADLGSGRNSMPVSVALLPPEDALSEAMFF